LRQKVLPYARDRRRAGRLATVRLANAAFRAQLLIEGVGFLPKLILPAPIELTAKRLVFPYIPEMGVCDIGIPANEFAERVMRGRARKA